MTCYSSDDADRSSLAHEAVAGPVVPPRLAQVRVAAVVHAFEDTPALAGGRHRKQERLC